MEEPCYEQRIHQPPLPLHTQEVPAGVTAAGAAGYAIQHGDVQATGFMRTTSRSAKLYAAGRRAHGSAGHGQRSHEYNSGASRTGSIHNSTWMMITSAMVAQTFRMSSENQTSRRRARRRPARQSAEVCSHVYAVVQGLQSNSSPRAVPLSLHSCSRHT